MMFNIFNKFILFILDSSVPEKGKYIFALQKKSCTVNVDFVTFEYVLLIKNQSISIWIFNLPIMQHNLIGPQIGNFHERYCLYDLWGGMRGCCWTASYYVLLI
jgi:hypothetical protein